MRSGRSSSEWRHSRLRGSDRGPTIARAHESPALALIHALLTATRGLLAASLVTAGTALAQEAIPPPPDDLDAPLARPRTSPRPLKPPAPKPLACPRCGYVCDPGWNYCVACGWDMRILLGEAEEVRLQAIARASVGVTVGGRRNRFSTAFPFGPPGHFVTNARVLIAADESLIKVRTYNNREYPATLVGFDLPSGVGLLKVGVPDLPPLEIAPASPSPPESSWAICHPVVFEDDLVRHLPVSLHRGHLTATGQAGTFLVSYEDLLRTDHAIEPGCTGGPLIDSRGRIAGMILGSPEDGITYVAPLDGLEATVASLVKEEKPARPFFGIGVVMADERRRAKFRLDATASGPLISYVIPGSPAALAGVQPGELLVAVGADRVPGVREVWKRLLAADPAGPGLALTLVRGGAERQVTVKPVRRPERVMLDPVDEIQETLEANLTEVTTGPGAQQGLLVSDLVRGGRGEENRFRNGDLIVGIDDKTVKTFRAFDDFIRTRFKEIFAEGAPKGRRYASSYIVSLEVRTARQRKVTREYVNLFPDFLAPSAY